MVFNPAGQIFFNKNLETTQSQIPNLTIPRRHKEKNAINGAESLRRSLPLKSKLSMDQINHTSRPNKKDELTIYDLEDSAGFSSSGGKISDDEH